MKKFFSLIMMALILCANAVYAEEVNDDGELFPVAYYIDNWEFTEADGDRPTNSWQQLPVFEDDMAVFDTSRNSKHPCFDGTSLKNYADEKYIVLDFSIKGVKKLIAPLRIFESGMMQYNGEALTNVTGYGTINITQNEWHRITYVMNMENAKVAGSTVSGIKPHALYIDGELQTMTKPDNTASVSNVRTWMEIKSGQNNSASNADIVYMNHYRTYVMDRLTVAGSSVKSGDVISRETDKIELEFSHSIDEASAETNIKLKKDNGDEVSVSVLTEDKKATIIPEEKLEYGRNYIIEPDGLMSADGELKYEAENISFFTGNMPLYEFEDISSDGKINVTNNWYENRTAVFVICMYNVENSLVSVHSVKKEIECNATSEITLADSIQQDGSIRVFVFDGDLSLAYTAFEANISDGKIDGTVKY